MSHNVWIHSGKVTNLFPDTTNGGTISNGVNGVTVTATGNFLYKDSPSSSYQAVVTGTGTVGATVVIEVSNDGVNAIATAAGTITLSGTTVSSDGFTTSSAPWKFVRARITAISGTGATVQVYQGV